MRRLPLLLLIALFLFDTTQASAQKILHRKKKVDKSTDSTNTAEPDKQLYDKALDQEKRGHFDVARLDLQTLLNTYPDSQYLMRAKLAVADCAQIPLNPGVTPARAFNRPSRYSLRHLDNMNG